jgi:hypothetical protein
LSAYSADLGGSKVDELEKQLQQLRSSIESTSHTQLVSFEAANEPATFTGSPFRPHYPLANQIPAIPHISSTPMEPRPRETLPADHPVSYFTAPSPSARSLDSITVSQKQIDDLFRMYMNQPNDEGLC